MRMDTSIPLQIQGPDIMGAMDRGTQAATNYNALRQQNALADIYRTQGAGIMAGDPTALNALAGMDPAAALGIQNTRQGMQFDAETMQMQRDEAKRAVAADVSKMTAEQRATEVAAIERGLTAAGMAYKSGNRSAYNKIITDFGMDPAQLPFDQFPAYAAQYSGVLDALKNAGEVFAPPPVDPTKGAPSGYMFTDPRNPAAGVAPLPGYAPKSAVEVNLGGGKFEEEFAKTDAQALAEVSTSGIAAARNIGRIDKLSGLLSQSPSGLGAAVAQAAGEWGINTNGLDDLQAAQAVINSLVPEQRQPGSGPMSDADLALFKQSLPRLINQPGGNQTIIATMKAIAEYDTQGATIVQKLRNGELSRAEAFSALQNRENPLAGIGAGASSPTPAAPIQAPAPQPAPPSGRLRYNPATGDFE